MSRSERAELTTLCMVHEENRILVLDRVDKNWKGLCFPGGHVEQGEAFVDAITREVYEETGLTIQKPRLCGVKQFQTGNKERYIIFLFKTNQYSGTIKSSEEGKVFWVEKDKLSDYQLVKDFNVMLKVIEDESISEVYYETIEDEWVPRIL